MTCHASSGRRARSPLLLPGGGGGGGGGGAGVLLLGCCLVGCLVGGALAKVPLDKDGEAMWGHVYMEDGATSFEFFRATFGGPYDCDHEGQRVFQAPLTEQDQQASLAAAEAVAEASADARASAEGIAEVVVSTLGTGCHLGPLGRLEDKENKENKEDKEDKENKENKENKEDKEDKENKENKEGKEDKEEGGVRGKIVLAARGVCSFNDKAIVAQKRGAAGLIVVNTAPGLLRMPAGVLKQKHGFDVTIPVVMISEAEGRLLARFLERDPLQRVRIIGENSVKGKLIRQGRCAAIEAARNAGGVEVNADGSTRDVSLEERTVKIAEGGDLHVELDGLDNPVAGAKTYEFLRGMFGGPLPRSPLEVVAAEPLDGCAPIENALSLRNKIALVERGSCMFTNKGQNVEAAGAAGMIVVNRDSKDLTRMWAGEKAIRDITIPAVMVTGQGGDALLANMPRPVLLKSSGVTNSDWQQAARFMRLSDWAEDDEERRDVFGKLANKHDPEKSENGHWERWDIIQKSFAEAENYYDSMSEDV